MEERQSLPTGAHRDLSNRPQIAQRFTMISTPSVQFCFLFSLLLCLCMSSVHAKQRVSIPYITSTSKTPESLQVLVTPFFVPARLGPLFELSKALIQSGHQVSIPVFDQGAEFTKNAIPNATIINLGNDPFNLQGRGLPRELKLKYFPKDELSVSDSMEILEHYNEMIFYYSSAIFRHFINQYTIEDFPFDVLIGDVSSYGTADLGTHFNVPVVINYPDSFAGLRQYGTGTVPIFGRGFVPTLLSSFSRNDLSSFRNVFLNKWIQIIARPLIVKPTMDRWSLERQKYSESLESPLPPAHYFPKGVTCLINSAFGLEVAAPIVPTEFYVGPLISLDKIDFHESEKELETYLDSNENILYICFGTSSILSKGHMQVLLQVFENFHKSHPDFVIFWSIPKIFQEKFDSIPSYLKISTWVPQKAVLGHSSVKAFVSQCGSNSVREGVWNAKPTLCLPLGVDQATLGMKIMDSGAGFMLNNWNSFEKVELITQKFLQLLAPETVYQAQRISYILRRSGGLDKAVQIIEDSALVGISHLEVPRESFFRKFDLDFLLVSCLIFIILISIFWTSGKFCLRIIRKSVFKNSTNEEEEEEDDPSSNSLSGTSKTSNSQIKKFR